MYVNLTPHNVKNNSRHLYVCWLVFEFLHKSVKIIVKNKNIKIWLKM